MSKSMAVVILIVWCFFFMPLTSRGQTLSFATVEWEPYAGKSLPGYGFGSTIINRACHQAGLQATFHFMPWKRALEETKKGHYDALYSAYYSQKRSLSFGTSIPYAEGPLVLCARKDRKLYWEGNIRSLMPYRLGLVRGYLNTPEIDRSMFLKKEYAASDLLNLRKLLGHRVDVIVIDRNTAMHLLRTNQIPEGGLNDIMFLKPILDNRTIHVLFSKARRNWQKHLDLFNRGLESIIRDGTRDKILKKYGFIQSPTYPEISE